MATALLGLALWHFDFGSPVVNASYDSLFRFTGRPVTFTNPVSVIFIDDESLHHFHQTRGNWDRALHARLLNRLADDGARLVLLDNWLEEAKDPAKDAALADAMRRLSNVVLMAQIAGGELRPARSGVALLSVQPLYPADLFMSAVRSNSAVPFFEYANDRVARKHWPFPSPGLQESLPWLMARVAGATLDDEPRERWLRYYANGTAWGEMGYVHALNRPPGSFSNHIVFIGYKPSAVPPDSEEDWFMRPGEKSRSRAIGGVEVLATAFLNLMSQDWLERPPRAVEATGLIIVGFALGAGLQLCRRRVAMLASLLVALAAFVGGTALAHHTNQWFPWMMIAGAQVPVALFMALARNRRARDDIAPTIVISSAAALPRTTPEGDIIPDAPDYELIPPPIGHGAYGQVWLARNAVKQLQALKVVYRSKFKTAEPFEREFRGVEHYKPISRLHPGLLCIDFVSKIKADGYFYYVMELGDPVPAPQSAKEAPFVPLDLAKFAKAQPSGRIPIAQCVNFAIKLADALRFLHARGLTHRDIKPSNIIFVDGEAKLADVGLMANALRPDSELTWVGTPGYMPPPPEPPGTVQADIYALGMVLYVASTGNTPKLFPELSATLVDGERSAEFGLLNEVILSACHPDRAARYISADAMLAALKNVEQKLRP